MKKFLVIFLFFLTQSSTFSAEIDYRSIYRNLEVPNFSFVHGVDPQHFYDNRNASYSVYPLMRLSSPLYFKSIKIVPGYYDLTPREHKGKDYLLFKENGLVKYIVPLFKKEFVPLGFYKSHLSREKRTFTQKIGDSLYRFVGNHFPSAKRKPLAKTYLEINDLNDNFVVIIVYYNEYRYYGVFRTVP